jgi:multimeric flavodoxin WrbA
MKVLLINGSPRKQGNTFVALSEVAKQLERQGVESEIVWVGNKAVRGCIACGTCKQKANGRCVFDDDVCNQVIQKMETCDAVIIGSPVYWGQPSGQVQCVQQRMLFAGGQYFQNKPAAAVCVCRRGGSTAAFQSLQMPFQMCNMPIVTSQYWNIAFGREPGQAEQDTEGMQTMRTLANNMAWLLKKTHGLPTGEQPEREPWQPMNFIR